MLRPDGLYPRPLHDAGYRLVGLEVPVGTPPAVLDVVAIRPETNALLVAEAKSGRNVETAQAQKLAEIDAASVVRSASIDLSHDAPPTVQVAYVGLREHRDTLLQGLETAEVEFPLLTIGNRIEHAGAPFADSALQEAVGAGLVAGRPEPPRIVRFDEHSEPEEMVNALLGELVADQSQLREIVSIRALAERLVPQFPLYGHAAKSRLLRKVRAAAELIEGEQPENFSYRPNTATTEEAIQILQTPEERDARGRTQAYQAIARRTPSKRTPKPPAEGQLTLEQLEAELVEMSSDDTDDTDDTEER